MSASDFVQRVMLLVSDLERENVELKFRWKEQEDKQLLIQITGPNRTPIHYEGSLKHGYSDGERWCFQFEDQNNNGDVDLPLSSSFTDLEIWLGGICIENFQDFDRLNGSNFFPDDNESRTGTGTGDIYFHPGGVTRQERGPVQLISASIGPMTYADYIKLTDEQLDLEEQIAFYDDVSWKIEFIYFHKDKIPGIMSLLDEDRRQWTMDDENDDDDDGDSDDDDDENDKDNDSDNADDEEDMADLLYLPPRLP